MTKKGDNSTLLVNNGEANSLLAKTSKTLRFSRMASDTFIKNKQPIMRIKKDVITHDFGQTLYKIGLTARYKKRKDF